MEAVFIKPPRKIWAFNSEIQNIQLPLAIPCLAAVLKKLGVKVKVIDCVPFKIGWESLRRLLEKQSADIILLSESEPLWGYESTRAAHLIKEVNPHAKVIAGGIYFSNLAVQTLKNTPIDYIIIGEGEVTLQELVKELKKSVSQQNFKKIKGLAYKEKGKVCITPPRPLIQNLDTLPFPDYGIMDMSVYSKKIATSHPLITMQHSRGCPYGCTFCTCWTQMGARKLINGKLSVTPRCRTKSVTRTIAEIEFVYNKYKCQNLSFIDDCWNLNPKWSKNFAEQILEKKIEIKWFAYTRADHIIRDERLGVLKKLVKSGLTHVCIGAESCYNTDLKSVNKKIFSDATKKAFQILKEKYPSVFRQATFIIGMRNENRQSLMEQLNYGNQLGADLLVFHTMTPFPGTPLWEELKKNDKLGVEDFRYYDMINPIIKMSENSKEEIENFMVIANKTPPKLKLLQELFSKDCYRRKVSSYFLEVSAKYTLNNMKDFIGLHTELDQQDGFSHFIIPEWYEK